MSSIYWDTNKIEAKLEIINENIKIRTTEVKHKNQDIEDFNVQIKELLDLKIRRTFSGQHRLATLWLEIIVKLKEEKQEWL